MTVLEKQKEVSYVKPVRAEDMGIKDISYKYLNQLNLVFGKGAKKDIRDMLVIKMDGYIDSMVGLKEDLELGIISQEIYDREADNASKMGKTLIYFDRFGELALLLAKGATEKENEKRWEPLPENCSGLRILM